MPEVRGTTLTASTRRFDDLDFKFGLVWAAIDRAEAVVHKFDEQVCTDYVSLMLMQTYSYQDCLYAVLPDFKWRGEYLISYLVRVGGGGGHSLHLENADSNEELGPNSPPEDGGNFLDGHPRSDSS